MMLCRQRRLWQGVMALGLASAPWLQAQTVIRNVSGKTWLLKHRCQGLYRGRSRSSRGHHGFGPGWAAFRGMGTEVVPRKWLALTPLTPPST